jgi:ribonuclease-3
MSERHIKRLEDKIGYVFNDKELALRSITHSSYGSGRRSIVNYERLEFLGDRVLGLLTAEKLHKTTNIDQGEMAVRLNSLVRKETCAVVSKRLDIGSIMLISPALDKQGGRGNISILGDICESIIASIYLDGGLTVTREFYEREWSNLFVSNNNYSLKDPKTTLQERAASINKELPKYTLLKRTGPDHKPLFEIEVHVLGQGTAVGNGHSKKEAELAAAINLLSNWKS